MVDKGGKILRHRSSYVVIAQDLFFPALFFQVHTALRPQFRFLATPKCLADLVAAGHTDINLADGRLWKAMGVMEETNYDRGLWWHEVRTEAGLQAWGHTVDSLFAKVHPDRRPVPSASVPFLGRVVLSRDALPNVARSRTFSVVADLFERSFAPRFGIVSDDQSLSHIPLTVVDDRFGIKLIQSGVGVPNRLKAEGGEFFVRPKLRVHIYPYGLCTIYLILSFSCARAYSTRTLISLLRMVFCDSLGGSSSELNVEVRRSLCSLPGLFDWLVECITRALHYARDNAMVIRGQRKLTICANTDNPIAEAFDQCARELLGLLTLNSSWDGLNSSFVRQYPSLFGKYAGEYVLSGSENLLLSFGPSWRLYSKRKTRSRFYWGLISVYRFALAQKFLALTLRPVITGETFGGRLDSTSRTVQARVESWLEATEVQHRRLSPWHRRFYHRMSEAIGLKTAMDELGACLDRRALRGQETVEAVISSINDNLSVLRVGIEDDFKRVGKGIESLALRLQQVEQVQERMDERVEEVHKAIQRMIYLTQEEEERADEILEDLLGSELWFSCSKEARWFLITAEFLYQTLAEEMDFSAAMIEYCKALEVELNNRVVIPVIKHIEEKVSRGYISVGSRRIGPEYGKSLTLGAFPFLFASEWSSGVTGKKYVNPAYDKEFGEFVFAEFEWRYDEAVAGRQIASVMQMIADYRNRAAHSEVVGKEAVAVVRSSWEEEVGGISSVLFAFRPNPWFSWE